MNQPMLTIVVTTYDRKELLIETIQSILKQGVADIEIIVGNDNTKRRVDAHYTGIDDARIRYINNTVNLGEWPNLRYLYTQSSGTYFTSIADDDLYADDFLHSVLYAIEKFESPDCIYTSFTEDKTLFNVKKCDPAEITQMTSDVFFDRYINHQVKAMGNCGFFKKEALDKIGGVVEWRTKSYADTWMTFYLAGNFEKVVYIDHPMIYFRDHSGSLSSNVLSVREWILSQKELLERMTILLEKFPKEKREAYLYQLLHFWCVSSFYSRVLKLKVFNFSLFGEYKKMITPYYRLLGKHRFTFLKDIGKKSVFFVLIKIFR